MNFKFISQFIILGSVLLSANKGYGTAREALQEESIHPSASACACALPRESEALLVKKSSSPPSFSDETLQEVKRLLTERGGQLEGRDKEGNTALLAATIEGKFDAVNYSFLKELTLKLRTIMDILPSFSL